MTFQGIRYLLRMKTRTLIPFLSVLPLCAHAQESIGTFTVQPTVGWSQQQVDWSIAGDQNGQHPNVLSELKWKKIRGPEIGLASAYRLTSAIVLLGNFRYQHIVSGTVNDSDYAGDNRAVTTAAYDLPADRGYTIDAKAELSYAIALSPLLSLQPHAGYIGRFQQLYMLDGETPLISGRELKSTYSPSWHGLTLGLAASYRMGLWKLSLDMAGVFIPSYSSKANWNLQDNFNHPVSFRHKSKGKGWNGHFELSQKTNKNIYPFLYISCSVAAMDHGKDILYLSDASLYYSRLNGVHSRSLQAGLGAKIVW